MNNYTYTIFDGSPNNSSGTEWPDHLNIEIEAASDDEAIDEAIEVMRCEAAGLNVSDDYSVGDTLHAIVWDEDGTIVAQPTYTLTAEDLGVDKNSVTSWTTAASYVATFPSDDEDGACDVEVQVGEYGGLWFVRTQDEAGGSDDASDESYDSKDDAEEAAKALAKELNEAEDAEDAEEYLARKLEAREGEEDPEGEWACYWDTIDSAGGHAATRYTTREQAEAAVELAQTEFAQRNPSSGSTHPLCGYEVRVLRKPVWVRSQGELT